MCHVKEMGGLSSQRPTASLCTIDRHRLDDRAKMPGTNCERPGSHPERKSSDTSSSGELKGVAREPAGHGTEKPVH